jgi:hypothetical protein
MNMRTTYELDAFLRDDLGWRRKELFLYNTFVEQSEAARKQALLRGAVAVLYAHWEGFVKSAADAYLLFVGYQRLNLSQLSTNFVALAARGRLRKAGESKQPKAQIELFQWLDKEWHSRAWLPKREAFTAGNLSSNVFKAIIDLIGLEYRPEFQLAERAVIDRLVEMRNGIAHGVNERVSAVDFKELYNRIDSLLTMVMNDIEAAAAQGRYKRAAPWKFSGKN